MASLAATSSSLDTSTEEVEESTVTSGLPTIISTGETQTLLADPRPTSATPRYSDTEWNHHAAAAAVAAQFQPPSPVTESDTIGGHLYSAYKHPPLCPAPLGDFKPPIFSEIRPLAGQEERAEPGGPGHAGPPHHSPDSGLAASEGLSGSDSPAQPPSPSLPSRPQPARSPYEWMKRPSLAARPCKEGPEGK